MNNNKPLQHVFGVKFLTDYHPENVLLNPFVCAKPRSKIFKVRKLLKAQPGMPAQRNMVAAEPHMTMNVWVWIAYAQNSNVNCTIN